MAKMKGDQLAMCSNLEAVLDKVRSGYYGTDDDFDFVAFEDDLDEVTVDVS